MLFFFLIDDCCVFLVVVRGLGWGFFELGVLLELFVVVGVGVMWCLWGFVLFVVVVVDFFDICIFFVVVVDDSFGLFLFWECVFFLFVVVVVVVLWGVIDVENEREKRKM